MERQALKRELARNQQREQLLGRGEPGALVVRHVGAENAHDLAATLATLHPDCVYEDVPTGRVFQGHEGARRFYEEWWTGLNLAVTPRSEGKLYWSDDGVHIAESCFRGRHLGPFLGIAPTGREVEFRFAVFVTFRDGLIAGEKFYYDLAGILRQIGELDRSFGRSGMESASIHDEH